MGAFRAVLLAVSASGAVGAALHRAGIFDQLPIHKPLNSIKSRLKRKQQKVVVRTARVTPVRPAAEGARSLHACRLIHNPPTGGAAGFHIGPTQVFRRSGTAHTCRSSSIEPGYCPHQAYSARAGAPQGGLSVLPTEYPLVRPHFRPQHPSSSLAEPHGVSHRATHSADHNECCLPCRSCWQRLDATASI